MVEKEGGKFCPPARFNGSPHLFCPAEEYPSAASAALQMGRGIINCPLLLHMVDSELKPKPPQSTSARLCVTPIAVTSLRMDFGKKLLQPLLNSHLGSIRPGSVAVRGFP